MENTKIPTKSVIVLLLTLNTYRSSLFNYAEQSHWHALPRRRKYRREQIILKNAERTFRGLRWHEEEAGKIRSSHKVSEEPFFPEASRKGGGRVWLRGGLPGQDCLALWCLYFPKSRHVLDFSRQVTLTTWAHYYVVWVIKQSYIYIYIICIMYVL